MIRKVKVKIREIKRRLKTDTGGRRRHSTGGLGLASGLLGKEGRGRAFAHADDTGPHAAFKRLL